MADKSTDKTPAVYSAAGIGEVFQSVVEEVREVYGRGPESPAGIAEEALRDPAALVAKFQNAVGTVSAFLRGKLPDPIKNAVRQAPPGAVTTQLQQGLAAALHAIVQGESIYEPDRFARVQLRPETRALLLSAPPQGTPTPCLNRMLLEDAYPLEFWRMSPGPTALVNAVDIELTFKSVTINEKGWVLFGRDTDQSQMEIRLATRLTPPARTS